MNGLWRLLVIGQVGAEVNTADDRKTALARYLEGPALLERTISALSATDLDAVPSQGGWTVRQIVHHVADGDDLWSSGIKAALGNTPAEFTLQWYWCQPQDVWAEQWAYRDRAVDVSLALLAATRAHVAQLLDHVPDAWSRSVAVRKPDGELVRLTVEAVVAMQADHLEHHVRALESRR